MSGIAVMGVQCEQKGESTALVGSSIGKLVPVLKQEGTLACEIDMLTTTCQELRIHLQTCQKVIKTLDTVFNATVSWFSSEFCSLHIWAFSKPGLGFIQISKTGILQKTELSLCACKHTHYLLKD